jgi:hypothetical protein
MRFVLAVWFLVIFSFYFCIFLKRLIAHVLGCIVVCG